MAAISWENCVDPQTGVATLKCLEVVYANTLQIIVSLAGLSLFVMLCVGGFRYLTSGGDPKGAESGKQTMTYAIIGMALMGLAGLIFLIIQNFTGVENLLKFQIPDSPSTP